MSDEREYTPPERYGPEVVTMLEYLDFDAESMSYAFKLAREHALMLEALKNIAERASDALSCTPMAGMARVQAIRNITGETLATIERDNGGLEESIEHKIIRNAASLVEAFDAMQKQDRTGPYAYLTNMFTEVDHLRALLKQRKERGV